MDSLFPFLQGLAPLQHVGLSRRTAVNRQPVNHKLINTQRRPTGSPSENPGTFKTAFVTPMSKENSKAVRLLTITSAEGV